MAMVTAIAAGKSLLDVWKYEPTLSACIVDVGEMAELPESVRVGLPVDNLVELDVGSEVGIEEGKNGLIEGVGGEALYKGLARFDRFGTAEGCEGGRTMLGVGAGTGATTGVGPAGMLGIEMAGTALRIVGSGCWGARLIILALRRPPTPSANAAANDSSLRRSSSTRWR